MRPVLLPFLLSLFAWGCAELPPPPATRPTTPISREGVPNLHRVSDRLYRSGQPTAQGMRELEALGIRTVINLRRFHQDDDEAAGTALKLVHIPFLAWTVTRDDALLFLRAISRADDGPFLVHCHNGADRTGTMIALYRIVMEDWSSDQAIGEMVHGGYGFNRFWRHLARFVEDIDVHALRRELAQAPGNAVSP